MRFNRYLILVFAGVALWAQSGQELYQQALMKERSQGDLAGAIQIYERIVKQHGSDRKLAAQALLQIAGCQERMGGENARRTYERLVKEYPDQPQTVAEARGRMAALMAPAGVSKAPRNRQVWAGDGVDASGSVSPDGRYMTFANWMTGDLGVRDLQTGQTRMLTNTGGWEKSGGVFAQDSVFSPDGKLIAYNWFVPQGGGYEVRVMNADGSGVRTVAFKGIKGYAIPRAWSADGQRLAIVQFDPNGLSSLHVSTLATGDARTVIPPRKRQIWGVSFSPDGRWIAHDSGEWGHGSDIVLLSLENGQSVPFVTHPAEDMMPMWSADGKSIRFVSNRGGSFGLYEMHVQDGRAAGNVAALRTQLGGSILPIGMSKSDAFHYGWFTTGPNVYEADFDPATGKIARPVLLSDTVPGHNLRPAYSPDGKSIAWLVTSVTNPTPQGGDLVVRDIASGRERTFQASSAFDSLAWSPDSRRILSQAHSHEANTVELHLLDVETGQFSLFASLSPHRNPFSPAFSKDGSVVYAMSREWGGKEWLVIAIDVNSRQKKTLYRTVGEGFSRMNSLVLSPDGGQLAFVNVGRQTSQLMLLPSGGGEARLLAEFPTQDTDAHAKGLAWTADGKYILARQGKEPRPEEKNPTGILRIEVTTGKITPLDFEASWAQSLSIHPSGRKIVFQSGRRVMEIWAAENILVAGK